MVRKYRNLALGMAAAGALMSAGSVQAAEIVHYDAGAASNATRGTGGFSSRVTVDTMTTINEIGALIDLANADASGSSTVTFAILDNAGTVLAQASSLFADDGLTYKWASLNFTFMAGMDYWVGAIANNGNTGAPNTFGADTLGNEVGTFNFFAEQRQLSPQLAFTTQASGTRDVATAFRTLEVTTGAVPEPATWGMMLLGFGLLGAAMRRRRTDDASRVVYA